VTANVTNYKESKLLSIYRTALSFSKLTAFATVYYCWFIYVTPSCQPPASYG